MLQSKADSGKDDINRALIGQHTYLIASISSPPILTQQQSKPARLRHAEFCPRPALPLPFPMEKPKAENCRLGCAELEIRQESPHSRCAASAPTRAGLGRAERLRQAPTWHGCARSHGGSRRKHREFHPATTTPTSAPQRKEQQGSTSLQNNALGWTVLMTVQVALQVNLHWEVVSAGD